MEITAGKTIKILKKFKGILQERELIINIVVVITNAKPILVNKLAILICEITRMEEMEKGIISMPTEITTAIWACSLVRRNPKEHFSESISKIVVGGSCTAMEKKIKIDPIIPALTANKCKSFGVKLDIPVTQLLK
jgi:hypothetical protein